MTGMRDWLAANDHPKGGAPATGRQWVRPRGETWYRLAEPRPESEPRPDDAHPLHALIAAGRVAATAVYAAGGRRIGRIAEIAIDDTTGEVAFVLMAEGGVLGFGERLRRLPWSALAYRTDRGGYVLRADVRLDGVLNGSGTVKFQRSADRGGWAGA